MAASLVQINQKRQREDFSEEDQNLHKRSRPDGLLTEFFTADDGDSDAVEDDLVLQVVKSLQEEINGTSDKEENSRSNGEVEERVILSSYEDLVNATDDQLGINPSSRISVEEDDNEGISNEFWSDLFKIQRIVEVKVRICSTLFCRIAIRIITEIMQNTIRFFFLKISKSGYKNLSRIWPHRGF